MVAAAAAAAADSGGPAVLVVVQVECTAAATTLGMAGHIGEGQGLDTQSLVRHIPGKEANWHWDRVEVHSRARMCKR